MDNILLQDLGEIGKGSEFSVLKESIEDGTASGRSSTFIAGPFAHADVPVRNNRIYTKPVLLREAAKYNEEMVATNSAVGELQHPYKKELMGEINLERGCHCVESLDWDGDILKGKSRVLETLPMGRIVKSYLDEGIRLGVSSRGFGTVGAGSRVNDDYTIKCWDVILIPSCKIAYMEALRENYEYIVGSDALVESAVSEFEKSIGLSRDNVMNAFSDFIAAVRKSKGL